MNAPIGVGIVGAGPVTQAIHIPTLSRLIDRFAIHSIVDINPAVAQSVADRCGAVVASGFDELLADPAVEVVAICTPPFLHAEQVIQAMEAGKKAVFCEKPLATSLDEAHRIAEAADRTGVPLIVGAMHTFDPAWLAVLPVVEELATTAHTVRSSIVLPFNDRYEDLATEIIERPAPPNAGELDAEARANLMSMAVLGLAVHDLPLVRRFMPSGEEVSVRAADLLSPFGYAISAESAGRTVEIVGLINAQWEPHWEFEAISNDTILRIEFTPSFVHAGSGVATVVHDDGTSVVHGPFGHNGYEGEWRTIHDIVSGDRRHAPKLTDLLADLDFVVALADSAADTLRTNEVTA